MIRMALIGCGAVVQQSHLPAISNINDVEATWIVDVQKDQAKAMAARYNINNVTADYTDDIDVDAVLISTPQYLHVPMCEHFLDRGIHVLCEKPLAITMEDATRLVGMAKEKNLVLAAGVFRRYYPVSGFCRLVIDKEWLGKVQRIDIEEGFPYEWDLKSRFMMKRDEAGGGVLIDTGSHTLDCLLYWFGFPEINLSKYCDNSENGVESDCEIRFSLLWKGSEVPVRVELSRTRTLRNSYQLIMSNGLLEVPANVPDKVWVVDHRLADKCAPQPRLMINLSGSNCITNSAKPSYFEAQLMDFCKSIKERYEPINSGLTVLPLVQLIERCYRSRQAIEEPWVIFQTENKILANELS